jgi:hypothetical protein
MMWRLLGPICTTAVFLIFGCAQGLAEKGGSIVTPDACQALGFSVRVVKDGTLYRVEVKVARDAKYFERLPEAALTSGEFNLPLKTWADSSGDRWASFSISKKLLDESKLIFGNNGGKSTLWYTFLLKDFPVSEDAKKVAS